MPTKRQPKKMYALFVAIMSASPPEQQDPFQHFHETNEYKLIPPTSMYLVGYVYDSTPTSHSLLIPRPQARLIISFAISTSSPASAAAPTFAALVVLRLLVGIGGSSVAGGMCAAIYQTRRAAPQHGGVYGCDDVWADSGAAQRRVCFRCVVGVGVLGWGDSGARDGAAVWVLA
ncbi:hypothetical protein EJ07DRAFT_151740 [Lizonia empirigonia]|nr:hypothetical protein EJ07DRAFT_151740 [Lizonia empirigonia]